MSVASTLQRPLVGEVARARAIAARYAGSYPVRRWRRLFEEVLSQLDEAEGADILLVKPGLPYLDVILRLRQASNLPVAAYHVSGKP